VETRYASVARRLAEGISTGEYPVGTVLPTEFQLADRFGVSRATVRSALRELQQLGLVSRRRNTGTRVEAARPAWESSGYTHSLRTVEDVLQYAVETQRRIQEIADEITDDELAARLDCRPGRRWLRVSSIRIDTGKPAAPPICWTDVYVDAPYAALVRAHVADYRGAIASLIEERTGRRIAEILQTIRAVGVPPQAAEQLQAEPHSHALEITRRYRDARGESFLISRSIHPMGRFAYSLAMRRQSQAEVANRDHA
jgi:GntR family transcriptional regulator